jgi:hypothetical protein
MQRQDCAQAIPDSTLAGACGYRVARGGSIPGSNVLERNEAQALPADPDAALIKGSAGMIVVWAVINLGAWLVLGAEDRTLLVQRFPNANIWLWLAVYGLPVINVPFLFIGVLGAIYKPRLIIMAGGVFLLLIGAWNLGHDLLAVHGLKYHGIHVNWQALNQGSTPLWYFLGVMQLYWGLRDINKYAKTGREGLKASGV